MFESKQKYPNSFIFFITPLQRAYKDKGCNFKYATNKDCMKYIPDGLHPTEEYHEILANKI